MGVRIIELCPKAALMYYNVCIAYVVIHSLSWKKSTILVKYMCGVHY